MERYEYRNAQEGNHAGHMAYDATSVGFESHIGLR